MPGTQTAPVAAPVRIETVVAGDAGFEAWVARWYEPWCDAYERALAEGRVDPVLLTRGDRLAQLRAPVATERRAVLMAVDATGRVVGTARADLPLTDNVSLCWTVVAVPPEWRRRGHGTDLLFAVRDLASADGRTSVLTEIDRPLDDGTPPRVWPGSAFAARRGLTLRCLSVRRDLALPVDPGHLSGLRREALPYAQGYRVECFRGPVAVADRDRMAALKARMSTDAPLGDIEYEPEVWDAARVVEQEDEWAAMGATWWTAVALASDGTWAAYSQLFWTPSDPARLQQEDTLVLREHRGHRLGMLVKLAALEQAAAQAPQARVVVTGNAASNTYMIAINEAMGFRASEACEEWQADLSELA